MTRLSDAAARLDEIKSDMAAMQRECEHKMTELARIHQSKEIIAQNNATELQKRITETEAKMRKWKVCESLTH